MTTTKQKLDLIWNYICQRNTENSLVYNLPIGKANMDDRIEYALQLIQTGTNTTIPYQIPNSSDEEEEGEEDEDEYQY